MNPKALSKSFRGTRPSLITFWVVCVLGTLSLTFSLHLFFWLPVNDPFLSATLLLSSDICQVQVLNSNVGFASVGACEASTSGPYSICRVGTCLLVFVWLLFYNHGLECRRWSLMTTMVVLCMRYVFCCLWLFLEHTRMVVLCLVYVCITNASDIFSDCRFER